MVSISNQPLFIHWCMLLFFQFHYISICHIYWNISYHLYISIFTLFKFCTSLYLFVIGLSIFPSGISLHNWPEYLPTYFTYILLLYYSEFKSTLFLKLCNSICILCYTSVQFISLHIVLFNYGSMLLLYMNMLSFLFYEIVLLHTVCFICRHRDNSYPIPSLNWIYTDSIGSKISPNSNSHYFKFITMRNL